MGVSPGLTSPWKNSIPSSAGVFGAAELIGLIAGDEREDPPDDFERDICNVGLGRPYACFRPIVEVDKVVVGKKEPRAS